MIKIQKYHPFVRASDEEIKREDDVLLQGATFSSAILFFYVNILFPVSVKLAFSLIIVFLTGSFYCFRAYAKIKDSPEYRVISSAIFLYLAGTYVFMLLFLFIPNFFPIIFHWHPAIQILILELLLAIPLSAFAVSLLCFPRRYGYFPRIRWIRGGHFPKLEVTNIFDEINADCM